MQINLSRAVPPSLAERIVVPRYDRSAVRAGIVHLGPGGFHRAHMARYTHDLMGRRADALRWGIVGVGLMPGDAGLIGVLAEQDNLYTLVERDAGGARAEVIGSLAGVIHAAGDSAPVLAAIDRPEVAIVSLTVTQAGYCIDNGTKRLDLAHPLIVRDLADPGQPASAIGILVAAYARRRVSGVAAFTALSCDNIQHNGDVLRRAVLDLAAAQDAGLAEWISANADFPNTMVDRITPVPTAEDRAWLADTHSIDDPAAVFCEPFSQWVIEDRFRAGRPAWDLVGAQFVDDVTPYEFLKLRLLNATHLAISAPGQLMGYARIDEALGDARLRRFAGALIERETAPTVPPPPGVDVPHYAAQVLERFANPTIRDTTERVNTDASLNYLLDPLRDVLAAGGAAPLLCFAVACWVRRALGRDDAGRVLRVANPTAQALAACGGPDLLRHEPTFGALVGDAVFVETVGGYLAALEAEGTAAVLGRVIG